MRRALALAAALAPALALAFTVPPAPPRFLYDGASILSGSERQQIESRLMELNRAGQQIGVCILPSLDGESVEDASLRIAETWKPGFKSQDNGALIAVFMSDRKMRIEIGYGLEGQVPDSVARQIVMEQMRPAFRSGRYGDGILNAVNSVAAAANGQRYSSSGSGRAVAFPGGYRFSPDAVTTGCNGGGGCCCWIILALFILRAILRSVYRPRFYGFGPQAVYRPAIPWWGWFLFGNAMSGGRRHRSGWYDGGGGGWGGGGGGSWGGGGGGSFGGGSFGGGGASGSW